MTTVSTFYYYRKPVRVVDLNDQSYLVIRDIRNIIGLSNPNRELAIYTDNKPLYKRIDTPSGPRIVRLVTMDDVMAILAPNNDKKAIKLFHWLEKEVFPHMFPERKIVDRLLMEKPERFFAILSRFMGTNFSVVQAKVKPNANR